ncbi:hypothetical protein M5689_008711 [Euphorbia peplus]|nr:hypothetical protein M5689_008711 [Euphorbia peplus]
MQNQECTMEESLQTMLASPVDIRQWEEARCPVCLEHPHNAVLLRCSSYENGCRPFVCNTSSHHSNCLDQFHKSLEPSPSSFLVPYDQIDSPIGESEDMLTCPLCRGPVYGWFVIGPAREFMNSKTRSCSTETCEFFGNYIELRKHARSEHPTIRPSAVDPERQENWTRLERETHQADLLSTLPSLDLGLDDNEQQQQQQQQDEMQIFDAIETEVDNNNIGFAADDYNVVTLRDFLCFEIWIAGLLSMRPRNYGRVNRIERLSHPNYITSNFGVWNNHYISRQSNRNENNARRNHGNINPNTRHNARRMSRDNRGDGHDNVDNNLISRQNSFGRRILRNSRRDVRHNNVNNYLNPRQNNSFTGNNTRRMRDRRLSNNGLNINGYNTRGDGSR